MKKVLAALFCVFGLLVFVHGYQYTSVCQAGNIASAIGRIESDEGSTHLSYVIDSASCQDHFRAFASEVISLLEEANVPAQLMMNENLENGRQNTIVYVYIPDELSPLRLETVTGTRELYSDSEEGLTTSEARAQELQLLDFTDRRQWEDYRDSAEYHGIYRLLDYGDVLDSSLEPGSLLIRKQDAVQFSQALDNSPLADDFEVPLEIETGQAFEDKSWFEIVSFLPMILVFVIVAALSYLVVFFQAEHQIMTIRLQGCKAGRIFGALFSRTAVTDFLAFCLTWFAAYLIVVGNFRRVNWRFLGYLLAMSVLCAVLLLIISLALTGGIHFVRDVCLLKMEHKSSANRYAAAVLKTVLCVLIIMPAADQFLSLAETLQKIIQLNSCKDELTNTAVFGGYSTRGASESEIAAWLKSLNENTGLNLIFQSIDEYSMAANGNKIRGIQFDQSSAVVQVNTTWVDQKGITDTQGSPVVLDPEQSYLLVPEGMSWDDSGASECQVIEITKGNLVFNRGGISPLHTVLEDPVIQVVKDDEAYFQLFGFEVLLEEPSDLEKLVTYTNENGNSVYWNSSQSIWNSNIDELKSSLASQLSYLLLYLIVLVGVQLSFSILFVEEKQKRLALETLLGKTKWQKYREVYILSILCFVISLACGIYSVCEFLRTAIVPMPAQSYYMKAVLANVIFLTADFAIITGLLSWFEKRKIIAVLKGDSV